MLTSLFTFLLICIRLCVQKVRYELLTPDSLRASETYYMREFLARCVKHSRRYCLSKTEKFLGGIALKSSYVPCKILSV